MLIKSKCVTEENRHYIGNIHQTHHALLSVIFYFPVTDLNILSRDDSFCKLNFVYALQWNALKWKVAKETTAAGNLPHRGQISLEPKK